MSKKMSRATDLSKKKREKRAPYIMGGSLKKNFSGFTT